MKTYKIEMIIQIDDSDGYLEDWIPQAITENLRYDKGEEVISFNYNEVIEVEWYENFRGCIKKW